MLFLIARFKKLIIERKSIENLQISRFSVSLGFYPKPVPITADHEKLFRNWHRLMQLKKTKFFEKNKMNYFLIFFSKSNEI